jgi:hypothetical protein
MEGFEEYKDQIAEMLAEVSREAVTRFENAIESKRLIFSQELKQSFDFSIMRGAEEIASEITFRSYGRFKDMKKISYLGHDTSEATAQAYFKQIAYFVEKTGVEKFAWVPGYEGKHSPSVKDISRIANAIVRSRKAAVDIRRGYSGTWYNENKMGMINAAKKRLGQLSSEWIANQVKKQLKDGTN